MSQMARASIHLAPRASYTDSSQVRGSVEVVPISTMSVPRSESQRAQPQATITVVIAPSSRQARMPRSQRPMSASRRRPPAAPGP